MLFYLFIKFRKITFTIFNETLSKSILSFLVRRFHKFENIIFHDSYEIFE